MCSRVPVLRLLAAAGGGIITASAVVLHDNNTYIRVGAQERIVRLHLSWLTLSRCFLLHSAQRTELISFRGEVCNRRSSTRIKFVALDSLFVNC